MCRNTLCKNFGQHYTGAPPTETDPVAHDTRYRLELKGRIRCKQCGQSFEIRNNQVVSPIARYFLSLSLPYAGCSNEQCQNHGYNVYEHYFDKGREKRSRSRYARAGTAYRVSCTACRNTLSLGEPLRLNVDLEMKRRLGLILEEVMSQSPPSATLKRLRTLKSTMSRHLP